MFVHWPLCYHHHTSAATSRPTSRSYSLFLHKHNAPSLPPPPTSLFRPPHNLRTYWSIRCLVRCSTDSNSKPPRGFGPSNREDTKSNREEKRGAGASRKQRKSASKQSGTMSSQAPGLSFRTDGSSKNISLDIEFEERLQAVRRSALEQKKVDEEKEYGAIDYDIPVESKGSTVGLGTKIGVGVAVVVFGLVFALGDFIPSGSVSPIDEVVVGNNKLSDEEKANLRTRLKQYEATLITSPDDPISLEGAAVTLSELGEYTRAASFLEKLSKEQQNDPDVFRLLGEVKYELKDYEGSAAAYRNSMKVSETIDFDVLRGLTNALLAANKPDEAVRILVASRERLSKGNMNTGGTGSDSSTFETKSMLDPVQVELLLGKAYSDWGHVSDAVSVYDQLISSNPNDFRGYLVKGIILRQNGNVGDAERMFIQARFFAPEKAKALVDRYSR